MSTVMLYIVAAVLLIISLTKSLDNTKKALKKGSKSFKKVLPEFIIILGIMGIILSVMDEELIASILGDEAGFLGVIISNITGSIALIPGFIAFPMADLLMDQGASIASAAGFISSLMMVGVVTFPMELKYFGKNITVIRNTLAFTFSFIVAYTMGVVL